MRPGNEFDQRPTRQRYLVTCAGWGGWDNYIFTRTPRWNKMLRETRAVE